jgi:tRNA A-37 threonylcarbamoyl transferase component Bud32
MKKIGKYEVISELGQGGMGKVYRAHDPLVGRDVAVKLMAEAQLVDEELRQRFYREARSAGKLKHPNIITIYDLGVENGVPYIVMEYLEGTDLKQLLKENKELPLYDRLRIAVQVANGLSYAHHHGIVHRDIKPGNIRVLDGGQVKIMDFGIARESTSDMTKTGSTIGTWHYMSPEQIVGKKVDHRSDIWALGVILFEMLAGRRPFEADSLTTLVYKIAHDPPPSFDAMGVEVPEPLAHIVQRALAKEPGDRYADAAELGRDLESYLSALSTSVDQLRTEIERDIRKYLQLATALVIKKQFDEAAEAARRALVLDPDNPDAKAMLERVRAERERAEREKQALALAEQGRKLLAASRYDAAVEAIEKAHALAPDSTRVNQIRTEVAAEAERRRRETAVRERLAAAERAVAAQKLSEAAAELRAALDVDPHHAEAKRLLSAVTQKAREEEASKERETALGRARAAMERKAYSEARRIVEQFLARSPGEAAARALLREILDAQTMVAEVTAMGTAVAPPMPPEPAADESPTLIAPLRPSRSERPAPAPPATSGEELPTARRAKTPLVAEKGAAVAEKLPAPPRRFPAVAVAAAVVVGIAVIGLVLSRRSADRPPLAGGTGFAAIDISPWARIESVKNLATGELLQLAIRETPCLLDLPSGKYEVTFVHPDFAPAFTLALEVKEGETVELRGAVPGFQHEKFLPEF